MFRVALTIAAALAVDFLVFFVGWGGSIDMNMIEIARTLHAQTETPTPENKRAFDAAWRKGEIQQFNVRAVSSMIILVVTAGGFFISGRQFERRRLKTRVSKPSDDAPLYA
jgi:hypothetical protein